jgi:glycosyltransferase involved in cell wall biosynthesis
MKTLIIHNAYGKYSGEEAVVDAQRTLLEHHGHEVLLYSRSSGEIGGISGQINAFISGFHNTTSLKGIREIMKTFKPDIVHIHNLYPLISPSILPEIRKRGIPIVMTVHNYRLICPNGLFYTHGEICEQCAGGHELMCIGRNCEGSLFKSTGYALRNLYARVNRFYLDNIDAYLCLTRFQQIKLIENGFPPERCFVLPNFTIPVPAPEKSYTPLFAIFAGRLNSQKGFDILTEAAALTPGVKIKAAGEGDPAWLKRLSIPPNLELAGKLDKYTMGVSMQQASFLVFTSNSYEGFPMVFLEAMQHGLPIIAPRLAGFPEIIDDGVNGLLFNPGDAADLAEKMQRLWDDPELCLLLGAAGRRKLESEYSEEKYYERLMNIYNGLT